MSEFFSLTPAAIAGVALGAIFYGGLWWSVRRLCGKTGGAWFFAGFLLRVLIALGGFYAIARRDWHGLAACLAGFIVSRIAITRLIRARPEKAIRSRSWVGS